MSSPNRGNQGQTNSVALFRELVEKGYRGGILAVRCFIHQFRGHQQVRLPEPRPLKPRQVAPWIMSRPDRIKEEDQLRLTQIMARCPELDRTAEYVRAFATMMTELQGTRLEEWLTAIEADELPPLRSLAIGMRRDQDAITNGLTLPHSSGAVEGAVTRAKAIKRATYGRANLDLQQVNASSPRTDNPQPTITTDEVGAHVVGYGPAGQPTGVRIEDGGQVKKPALADG